MNLGPPEEKSALLTIEPPLWSLNTRVRLFRLEATKLWPADFDKSARSIFCRNVRKTVLPQLAEQN